MTEFRNMWTMGNIFTGGGLLVAVALSWGDNAARSEQNSREIAKLEVRLASMESKVSILSEQSGRFDERLANILTYVQRIDANLTAIQEVGKR